MSGVPVNKRIDAIQVLRACAAVLVVITHAIGVYDDRPDLPRAWLGNAGHFNSFGAIGVDIFFVISGFIMAHAVTRRPDLGGGQFITERLIRVAPPYWLAGLAMVPFAILWTGMPGWQSLASGAVFFPLSDSQDYDVPILRVGWSLAYELGFYLVVALIIDRVAAPQLRVPALLAAVCGLASLGVFYQPGLAIGAVFINAIWFEFALGLVVYMLWANFPASALLALMVLLTGLAVMAKHAVLGPSIFDGPSALIAPDPVDFPFGRSGLVRSIGWGVPAGLVVLGLLWCASLRRAASLTQSRPWGAACRLGDASYALYLIHPFIVDGYRFWAPRNALPADLVIIVLVGISIALALLVHRRVEQPLIEAVRAMAPPRGSAAGKMAAA